MRHGSQTPRVRTAPPYSFTSGPDAVELAKSAGVVLDPWQCSILDDALGERANGTWSAGTVSVWVPRQNGKGTLIESRVLYGLFVLREKLILWSAHQYRTAQEGFLRIRDLIRGTPELDAQVKRYWEANGEQGIELRTGERLRFVARSRSAARGFSGDLVILDEAQFLTEAQLAALLPTMSARPNPQLWYLGTPPDDPEAWVYNLREDGVKGRDRLVHYDWGLDLDPTKPEDVEACSDRDLWFAANPALGIRITEEYVASELAALKSAFAAERLGAWLPRATAGSGVIPDELWRGLVVEPELPESVSLCIDVSHDRSRTSIIAVGKRSDGRWQLSVVDYRPGTKWVAERVASLREKWDPVAIAMDTKRAAGSLLSELEEVGVTVPEDPAEPGRGDLACPSATEVGQAYGMFVDEVVDRRNVVHLDEAPLNIAVSGATTRSLSGGTAWDHKGSTDISPLVAATNAMWAHVIREPLVMGEYDPLANIF